MCFNSPRPAGNPLDTPVCCSLMLREQGGLPGLVLDAWLEGWERLEVAWICLGPSAATAARQQSFTVTHTLLKATFPPKLLYPSEAAKAPRPVREISLEVKHRIRLPVRNEMPFEIQPRALLSSS